jgi:type IV secretion system protein VirB6
MGGLFQWLGNAIDAFLLVYVAGVSARVAAVIAVPVATAVTIWVIAYGYAVMRGEVPEPMNVFLWKAVKISTILSIALSAAAYQSVVIDGANALQVMFQEAVSPGSRSAFQTLDGFALDGMKIVRKLLETAIADLPFGGYSDLLSALITLLGMLVLLILGGGWIIIAKVAMSLVLGLGPAFIAALAFPAVARFFESWLSLLLGYVFLVVVVIFIISMSISISAQFVAQSLANYNNINQFDSACALLVLTLALGLLMVQAPTIASHLVGGGSITSGGAGFLGGALAGKFFGGGKKEPNGNDKNSVNKKGDGGSRGGGNGSQRGSAGGSGAGRSAAVYQRATIERLSRRFQ